MQLFLGMPLLIADSVVTGSTSPLTHPYARVSRDWTLSRVQVDHVASTTFLTAFIGLLMVVVGPMMTVVEVVPSQPGISRCSFECRVARRSYIRMPLRLVGTA